MSNKKSNEKKRSIQNLVFKFILLGIVLIILIIAFFSMLDLGAPILVALLVDLFLFLFFTGLIFKSREKSLISRIFPSGDKKIQFKVSSEEKDQIDLKPKTLQFKYQKSLIRKCPNCDMILTRNTKRCPICGKKIPRY
jgi:hypothetical protein